MARLNYTTRLNNLQSRRYDPVLQKSIFTESFSRKEYSDDIKYLYESMKPIEPQYNKKTTDAAENVRTHLEGGFELHFARDYHLQGSVITNTNIKVYSDIDLLTIIKGYYFNAPNVPNQSIYTKSDPVQDIKEMRKQATAIMKRKYDEVNSDGAKSIYIFNKNLKRKVDIVFCFWYHTAEFNSSQNQYHKGVYLFDFGTNSKILDFPFAHIHEVNSKGETTNDNSRKGIRLLKTLKADSEVTVNISSYALTSIVHAIDNSKLYSASGDNLKIASTVSKQLDVIINNHEYRKKIKSPNGREYPLIEDKIVPEILSLKQDLDILITDCSKDITSSLTLQKMLLTY